MRPDYEDASARDLGVLETLGFPRPVDRISETLSTGAGVDSFTSSLKTILKSKGTSPVPCKPH